MYFIVATLTINVRKTNIGSTLKKHSHFNIHHYNISMPYRDRITNKKAFLK